MSQASSDLQRQAELALEEAMRLHPLPVMPAIHWKRLRVTAGIAYYRQNVIALSSLVLVTEDAVRETLLHEYAHLLAVHRHGAKAAGHGVPWRIAMRDLGIEPKVRHSFEVHRNTPRQKVTHRCTRCAKEFLRTRRLPKRKRYVHVGCGGDIKLHSVCAAQEVVPASQED